MTGSLSHEDHEQFNCFVGEVLRSSSIAKIERELSELVVPRPFRLRMKVLYGRVDPYQTVRRLAQDERPLFRSHIHLGASPPTPWALTQEIEGVPTFTLTGSWGRETVRNFRLPFVLLPTDQQNIRVAITIGISDYWRQLLRFLKWQYPNLVPIRITQKELIEGIREYRSSANNFEVRVREYSAKEHGKRGRIRRTVREWTDEDLGSIVEQIYERSQVISSIKLAFYRILSDHVSPVPSLYATLTRDGRVEISGKYRLARNTIVKRLARVGAEKLKSYAGRGMRQREYRPAPLRIDFRSKVMSNDDEIRHLLEVLKSFPRSMYSIQHGNPYVHMRIFDAYDGSGYDIWAVSSDSLVLMPRTKSTEAAIERIISHIFENFSEGTVDGIFAS